MNRCASHCRPAAHVGFAVHAFSSAEAFLESEAMSEMDCLLLDVGLPGLTGPDLQLELIRRGPHIPIVFITAQDDKSLRPRLVAHGAAACLFKPFSDTRSLKRSTPRWVIRVTTTATENVAGGAVSSSRALMSIPHRLKCAETWASNQGTSSVADLPGLRV